MSNSLFTSESVTEGHPDKICDKVSDSILDAIIADDPGCRVACETLVKTGYVNVAGEITTTTYVDIPSIVRDAIREIGYVSSDMGFDANRCGVLVAIPPAVNVAAANLLVLYIYAIAGMQFYGELELVCPARRTAPLSLCSLHVALWLSFALCSSSSLFCLRCVFCDV